MTLQFIQDNRGNTTGVYIPIEEWLKLKSKYTELQQEEAQNIKELATWQTQIIDQRLSDYYAHPDNVADFDKTIEEIEKTL